MLQRIIPILLIALLAGCAHDRGAQETVAEADKPAYDAELSDYDYPREVKYFSVPSQRRKTRMAYIAAEAQPENPDAEVVLLLHGKNFSAAYWEPTIEALSQRGFHVIAPDQVGFGKSSKPKTYQFSFHQLAEHTKDLLDSLNVRAVHVVGHSMGGMLATRFALMYPERTTSLTLVNPIGLEDYKTLVDYRTIDQHYRQALGETEETIRHYQRQNYFDGAWKPEYEELIEIQAGWTRHSDHRRIAWMSALTTDMIFTQPVVYEFPNLKTPTLLIIGQKDRTAVGKAWAEDSVKSRMGDYPALGRAAAAAIPNAQLVEIPGVGHLPQVEAFELYIQALSKFLKSPQALPVTSQAD